MMTHIPHPTSPRSGPAPDFERQRWENLLAGESYFYGSEPGPLARRAVRYHRALLAQGGTALDAGCGEGQDLAFLAACGYESIGIDFINDGLHKARNLLHKANLQAQVQRCDLRDFRHHSPFDLVVASNSLQFLGKDAEACLKNLMLAVAPGGVIGLSLFAREETQPAVNGTLYFATLAGLLERFINWQPLEAATLYQWNLATGQVQPFVTLIARNTAPVGPVPIAIP